MAATLLKLCGAQPQVSFSKFLANWQWYCIFHLDKSYCYTCIFEQMCDVKQLVGSFINTFLPLFASNTHKCRPCFVIHWFVFVHGTYCNPSLTLQIEPIDHISVLSKNKPLDWNFSGLSHLAQTYSSWLSDSSVALTVVCHAWRGGIKSLFVLTCHK